MGMVCAIFWAGCGGKHYHSEVSSADTTAGASKADTVLNQAKLVKTADMRFKVKDVRKVGESIAALTVQYNGMVMHYSMASETGRTETIPQTNDSVTLVSACTTNANMVVKVPSLKVDEFLDQVGKMAVHVNTSNMDIRDMTFDYLEAQMKLQSRGAIIDQQKKGIVKIKDPAAVMNLKDDLIDQQINNKRIDDAVKYSTVVLNFYQSDTIVREVVVNNDPSNFRAPFFTRLGYSLANGWTIFTDALVAIATFWIFILAAIALWLGFRYYKRKNTIAAI